MTERLADHPIDPLFLARWSPRAYDGQPMPEADLLRILEAEIARIGAAAPRLDRLENLTTVVAAAIAADAPAFSSARPTSSVNSANRIFISDAVAISLRAWTAILSGRDYRRR